MVTVEVVAKDHKGQNVPGLTANEFQVFEQLVPKREHRPQKIAAFRATTVAEIAAKDTGKVQMAPGVYTNLITMYKVPVPPTILLVDGLNTDRISQLQVHRQMLRMLASIPDDVPTAVYLLGRRLQMAQSFTTDPKLLKSALQKTSSVEHDDATQVDPRNDPDAMSAFLEDNPTNHGPAPLLDAVRRFEQETFAFQMDIRVQETLDALRAIARHVAGYPGRKNLLWISSSFPIWLVPDSDAKFSAMRNYGRQVEDVANALADAKVAVYPMDPRGLQTIFKLQDEFSRQESMQALADQTGGKICVYDNDLADCVKKAMDDSSYFYEIAYYPDSGDWHGEFHQILVKSTRPGIHLTYRQGYYARDSEGRLDQKSVAEELEKAACQDFLTSTSVLMVAKAFPEPGRVKYFVAIEPNTVTFAPQSDGSREVKLKIGLCTFDKSGKPVRFLQDTIDEKLTDKQYAEVQAQHGFARVVSLVPTPGIAVVRVLVKDMTTGNMGSVNIPYVDTAAAATSPAAEVAPATQHPN